MSNGIDDHYVQTNYASTSQPWVTCSFCGTAYPVNGAHQCSGLAKPIYPYPQPQTSPQGWKCPTCGRGVAPWMQTCPCVGQGPQSPQAGTTFEGGKL